MSIRHAANRFTSTYEGAHHVRGQDARQAYAVHLVHAHLPVQDCRIVHEHGQAAEFCVHGIEKPKDVGLIRYVCLDGDSLSSCRFDRSHCSKRSIPIATVVHTNVVSSLRSQNGRRSAYAATGTGNQHYLSHLSCSLSVPSIPTHADNALAENARANRILLPSGFYQGNLPRPHGSKRTAGTFHAIRP